VGERSFPWGVVCVLLTAAILVLGILLVRVNNDRVELAYELKKFKSQLERAEDLRSKLEVERNNLKSHHRLGRLAEQYGLQPAAPGQIRAIGTERERGK
jgi:cell division protein FtsL